MIEHSPTITHLMGAMLRVQGAVDGVAKDSKNPAFRSSYASLESVVETIRPHCQAQGLVVMQAPGALSTEGERLMIAIETMIVHAESGEWIKSGMQLPLVKNDPQGVGSAITYGERYALMAMLNLPPVDDDGEAASARSSSPPSSISQRAETARRAPAASPNMAPNARDRAEAAGPLPDKDGMLAAIARSGSMKALNDLIAKQRWQDAMTALFPPDRPTVENAVADRLAILSDLRETA